MVQVALICFHLLGVRVQHGLLHDPRVGDLSKEGLHPSWKFSLFPDESCSVQLSINDLTAQSVHGLDMCCVRVRIFVEEGKRDSLKGEVVVVRRLVPEDHYRLVPSCGVRFVREVTDPEILKVGRNKSFSSR